MDILEKIEQRAAEYEAKHKAQAERNRAKFPGIAHDLDAYFRPHFPACRVLWAKENGNEIGKRVTR